MKGNAFFKALQEQFDIKDKKKRGNLISLCVTLILVVAVVILLVDLKTVRSNSPATLPGTPFFKTSNSKIYKLDDEPKAEVTISTQIIEDGLRNMGVLITQEYFFTQVESYEKEVPAEIIPAITSTARVVYSYDGVVSAGIDCEKILIKRDEEDLLKITVVLPEPEIQYVDIDLESFKLYEEKQGLWSKIKLADVNKSLVEFKNSAKEKALEKDILSNARTNAEAIVIRFIKSVAPECAVVFYDK